MAESWPQRFFTPVHEDACMSGELDNESMRNQTNMVRRKGPEVAILVCTCAAYSAVAEAACNLLDKFWPAHPDLYIVGGSEISDRKSIIYSCDEKDWIGMSYEAVSWLYREGYSHCYLILDDHPPVGLCNDTFLNETLPSLSEGSRASHVALAGWDQFQPKDGDLVPTGSQLWMRSNRSFRWKFDLHPGFWNLADLMLILEQAGNRMPRAYTAREFEGLAGSGELELPNEIIDSTFKIEGDRNVVGSKWFQNKYSRRVVLYALHTLRIAARAGGSVLLGKVDKKTEIYTQYINGPYPMYWSGVIKKGRMNENLHAFVELTKNDTVKNWLTTFDWPPSS